MEQDFCSSEQFEVNFNCQSVVKVLFFISLYYTKINNYVICGNIKIILCKVYWKVNFLRKTFLLKWVEQFEVNFNQCSIKRIAG